MLKRKKRALFKCREYLAILCHLGSLGAVVQIFYLRNHTNISKYYEYPAVEGKTKGNTTTTTIIIKKQSRNSNKIHTRHTHKYK